MTALHLFTGPAESLLLLHIRRLRAGRVRHLPAQVWVRDFRREVVKFRPTASENAENTNVYRAPPLG